MKGGKADKTRPGKSSKPGKLANPHVANAHPGANKSKGGVRPPNVAPPKGARKRPGSGGSSSSGED